MSVSALDPVEVRLDAMRASRLQRALSVLPRGRTLPPEVWSQRHRAIVALLWVHVAGILIFGLVRGYPALHVVAETGLIAVAAAIAGSARLGRTAKTMISSLGLLSCSGILVHLSGGLIEMHFHFFVMVTVVALYQDWLPFLAAIGYVLLHHGLVGVLDPDSVYNHPAAWANPWTWAGIHSLFIAGISSVCLATWRLNESSLAHRNRAEAELRFQKTLLEFQNEATLDGVLVISPGGQVLSHNQRFLDMWGFAEDQIHDGFQLFRAMLSTAISADGAISRMNELIESPEESRRDEIRLVDGRVLDVWTVPLGSTSGYGRAWYFRDITKRRLQEEELKKNNERFEFLAEASALLGSSLDYEKMLDNLAKLAVDRIADWCAIDLIHESGVLQRLAAEHAEPTKSALVRELADAYATGQGVERPILAAIETGAVQFSPETVGSSGKPVGGGRRADILEELGYGSELVCPLQARGRTLGTMTFVKRHPGAITPADRSMLEEVARRAGIAIDNARLYQDRSHVAATLQKSLLPPLLPEIEGVELAARYLAAGDGIEVGGDFYDVFATGEDEWAVVIGDVCGKGADAAALTGLARYTLRAAAMQARKPSRVLSTLNEALLSHDLNDRFCTLSYVRLKPEEDGLRLTVCAAGHPLPMVLTASGETYRIGEPGTLLGQFEDPILIDTSVTLAEGDLCVLFTDGVIEARGTDGELADEGLEQLLKESIKTDAASIAQAVAAKAVEVQEGRPHDDIAVLVIKVRGASSPDNNGVASKHAKVSDVPMAPIALEFDLKPDDQAPAHAREVIRQRLDTLEAETKSDLELLVTELITNAVRHADLTDDDKVVVSVKLDLSKVLVEVCNPGEGFTQVVPDAPHPLQESGRGLWLVKMLAQAWGVKPEMPSCVWFELHRSS